MTPIHCKDCCSMTIYSLKREFEPVWLRFRTVKGYSTRTRFLHYSIQHHVFKVKVIVRNLRWIHVVTRFKTPIMFVESQSLSLLKLHNTLYDRLGNTSQSYRKLFLTREKYFKYFHFTYSRGLFSPFSV